MNLFGRGLEIPVGSSPKQGFLIMKRIGETNSFKKHTVNSKKKDLSTVNSNSPSKKIEDFVDSLVFSNEDLAKTLAKGLGDEKSLSYYELLAQNHPHGKLIEALSFVKDTDNREGVKRKPVYFQAILRNWGYQVKFRQS